MCFLYHCSHREYPVAVQRLVCRPTPPARSWSNTNRRLSNANTGTHWFRSLWNLAPVGFASRITSQPLTTLTTSVHMRLAMLPLCYRLFTRLFRLYLNWFYVWIILPTW